MKYLILLLSFLLVYCDIKNPESSVKEDTYYFEDLIGTWNTFIYDDTGSVQFTGHRVEFNDKYTFTDTYGISNQTFKKGNFELEYSVFSGSYHIYESDTKKDFGFWKFNYFFSECYDTLYVEEFEYSNAHYMMLREIIE